jgi:hypothetical protein
LLSFTAETFKELEVNVTSGTALSALVPWADVAAPMLPGVILTVF